MAIDELPPVVVVAPDQPQSGEERNWLKVAALWAAAVGAQAVILLVLTQYGTNLYQTRKLEFIAELLADGRVKDAKTSASLKVPDAFPTELLVDFALLGIAVIALAWVGRRSLAITFPFFLGIVSMSPSFSEFGSTTPKPISELYDISTWQLLQLRPTGTVIPETWPTLLGLVVQTALLLLPLIAAPRRRAAVPLMNAARTAALPTLAVMVLALGTLSYSDVTNLYGMPVVVAVIGFLSAAVATGTGSVWVRLPAAIGVPTVLAATSMPFGFSSMPFGFPRLDTSTFATAVSALIIALGVMAAPWARSRLDRSSLGNSAAAVHTSGVLPHRRSS